jgi:formylglycine-generating enzyme required for sulfatase activity
MNWLKALVLLAVVVLSASDGACNGIDVTNISLGTRDAGTGNAPINFDISWSNSWRSTGPGAPAPNNWDAAWVFVKFRKNGGDWAHASLNDTGHTVPSGASLDVGLVDTSASFNIATNPAVGVFIYRSADGVGTFSKTGFSLSWKYTQDGVGTGDTIDIRVFAIEMVYVPTGSFFAGDNATSIASFRQGSTDTDPWYIGSESEITTGTQAGSGTGVGETNSEYRYVSGNMSGEDSTGTVFTIPAEFPKGYQKFYMMKGEISQGQWVAFFNTLTTTQRSARDITASSGKNSDTRTLRNNVSWSSGDATLPDAGGGATYATVAMGYLSWADLAAYLDWVGLRPMSELEFEKAGRGPYRAVSGEYAWGSTSITGATSISNAGKPSEAPGAAGNCVYGNVAGVQGPMRVGAMAAGDATRIASGAGYYGAMDLSGNLWERPVTVGNSTGRGFIGAKHGNGVLTSGGDGNVTTWPATDAVGSGFRGGDWGSGASSYERLSDRHSAAVPVLTRWSSRGGRGVRSAP